MEYGIKQLSELAGVSARTLRYYDEIGLLKPLYTTEAGYRFYGEQEVMLLQQILFYRERGFSLGEITRIIYHKDFDIQHALQEHLLDLEEQKVKLERMIHTVRKTISSMKGETEMSAEEKFEVFKKNVVKEQEERYGAEARRRYGDEQVDASQKKVLDMTEADYQRFVNLGNEILEQLKEAVQAGEDPKGEKGRRLMLLHKEWLGFTWKVYTENAHKGLVNMYVQDPRFTQYYDREVTGCAEFLRKAVEYWISVER